MTSLDKLALLEEILDVEKGFLAEEMCLAGIKEWDSLAKISFICTVDEKFNRIIDAADIRGCQTVSDLLHIME